MLKQVGQSGQISVGKRHAGKLFQLVAHADGRLELIPMTLVTSRLRPDHVEGRPASSLSGWRPPGGYEHANSWAVENRAALEAYAREIDTHGTAAEQLQQFLDASPAVPDSGDGAV